MIDMWVMGMWGDGMHGAGWWWGLLVLPVLLLTVTAAVLVAVSLGRSGSQQPPQERGLTEADRVLDERYARGEIDEQEYLHRKAVLRSP